MSDKRIDFLASAACFGSVITGLAGIIVAIISLVSMNLVAAGVSVVGASLAFGLLANAVLRD
jgi:hypothetical protein